MSKLSVMWRCRDDASLLHCPLCNEKLTAAMAIIYSKPRGVRCPRCHSFLGIRGIEFSEDLRDLAQREEDGNELIYSSTYISMVMWQCRKEGDRLYCPVCDWLLPDVMISIYQITDIKRLSHTTCSRCHSFLGVEGLSFDIKLFTSSLKEIEPCKHDQYRIEPNALRASNKTESIARLSITERKKTDPYPACKSFLQDTCIVSGKYQDRTKGSTIWSAYVQWVDRHKDTEPLGRNAFYAEMDKLLGRRIEYKYLGVKLK